MSPALQQVQEQLDKGSDTERSADGSSAPIDGNAPVQESFKTLISIMSESLKNTRSAFYASLSGILASVLLLLCNWFVSWRQVSFLAEVEYLTATKLIPIFKPPPEATQLAEVVGAFREGSDYLVKLSKGLDDREAEVGSHLAGLFGIMKKFREGADALEGNQELVNQAQDQMKSVVDQFVALTSRIEANQAGAHGDLAGVVQAVNESNKNLARALEDWQSQREEMLQSIDRAARQAHAETKESHDLAQKGIDEVAGLIRTSVDQQVTTLRELAIDLLKKQQVGAHEHLREVLDRQGEFVSQLQKSVAESDGHKELLTGLATAIEQERKTFADGMSKMLQTNEQVLRALMADQKQLLDISGMRKVEDRLEIFMRESQKKFSALMERHSAFGQQFGQLGSLADRLGGMLRLLIGIAAVTLPVFAALGIMYIFDLRPADLTMRIISMLMIVAMIFAVAWLLRAKS
ncbi:MAG: hypothetical protein ACR2H4_09835 [Pyrinomonadaceae bacterium]